MALESKAELPGRSFAGLRRMGDLEAGICAEPERIPGPRRSRLHDPFRKGRHHIHTLRDCLILAFITLSAGAVGGTFLIIAQRPR